MSDDRLIFYGRRKGRPLNAGRQRAMDDLFPGMQMPVDPPQDQTELQSVFGPDINDIWLEIGFGNGEHLAEQAARNPQVGMLGCEPYINGVSALVAQAGERDLDNIRIHADDARPLMDNLPEACIGRAFVLFADPWPKARHARRRFIGPDNLDRLARLIRPGGELRLATDWPQLAAWMLQHTLEHPAFEWLAESASDWRKAPDDWVPTRYQIKTEGQGRKPVFLLFRRV
ncbi:MAG: tRNA (guanosine(46)-N7)-methyltransferase TrmB [Alphaproteobacteria bacterium]